MPPCFVDGSTTIRSRCKLLVKMAELAGLCVEANDAGTTTGNGSYNAWTVFGSSKFRL